MKVPERRCSSQPYGWKCGKILYDIEGNSSAAGALRGSGELHVTLAYSEPRNKSEKDHTYGVTYTNGRLAKREISNIAGS